MNNNKRGKGEVGGFWRKGGFTVASAFPCGVVESSCVEVAERLLAMVPHS